MENIFANIGANVVYPSFDQLLSAFDQLLLEQIISESEKFFRVYGSSILTVKQSMKGRMLMMGKPFCIHFLPEYKRIHILVRTQHAFGFL